MKHIHLLLVMLLLTACSSDSSSPEDGLPPETQTGANTFGCLIDGKLYKPRCEKPSVAFPQWGAIVWGSPSSYDYNEIEVRDLKSQHGFNLLIHFNDIETNLEGAYQVNESNGENGIDGLDNTYLHCVIYDKKTNVYKKYVSFENSGEIIVTKSGSITGANSNQIFVFSGTFSARVRNILDPTDEIEITNGRFDINPTTVIYHEFP